MGWPRAQVHVRSPPSLTTVVAHDYVTLEVLADSPASAAQLDGSLALTLSVSKRHSAVPQQSASGTRWV